MSILGGKNGFIEKNYDFMLLAYTNKEIGTAKGYRAWKKSFADILETGEFSKELRLTKAADQRPEQEPFWKYLTVFGFKGDKDAFIAAVNDHCVNGEDACFLAYQSINVLEEREYAADDTEEHIFMALTDFKPGREVDFHQWYNEHHVKEIIALEPYRSGRRFTVVANSGMKFKWPFLAFYRFVGTPADMHVKLREEVKNAKTPVVMTDAYKLDDGAWVFSEIE